MQDPLVVVSLALALALGTVGTVFLTSAASVVRRRGWPAWAAGLALTLAVGAAWWLVDDAARPAGALGGWMAVTFGALLVGMGLGRTLVLPRVLAPPPDR